jgi:hypothetical protein
MGKAFGSGPQHLRSCNSKKVTEEPAAPRILEAISPKSPTWLNINYGSPENRKTHLGRYRGLEDSRPGTDKDYFCAVMR